MSYRKILCCMLTLAIALSDVAYCQLNEWTNYSFANEVNSIAEDDSLLWIGTDVGLVSFNKINENKTWFDKSNFPLLENGVLQIAIDKYNNKWLATKNGLIKYNDSKWEVFDKNQLHSNSNYISSICIENDSVVWFCTDNMLCKYNNGFTFYELADSLLKGSRLSFVSVDNIGNVWIGTSHNGLLKFNGTWKIYNSHNSKLPNDNITSLYIDKKNKLWIGTLSGLCIFSSDKWKIYRRFKQLKTNSSYVESTTEDKQGNIWLFTSDKGIRKYSNGKFSRYDYWNTDRIDINHPNCGLVDSNNNLWVGTHTFGGYLFKYDQIKWQQISYTSFPTTGHWLGMQFLKFDNDGNLWVGTGGINIAMSKYNGKEWSELTGKDFGVFVSSAYVRDLAIDSKGNRWFISDKGLVKYDGSQWNVFWDYAPKNKKYFFYDYSSIAIDNNDNIWIGTPSRGLFRFDGNSWINYSTTNSSIPSNTISSIAVDENNNIWFGSDSALTKLDTLNNFSFYNSTNSSFPSCAISKLVFGFSNNLWIGTFDHGLIKFNGEDFQFFNQIDSSNKTISVMNDNPLKDLKNNNTIFLSYGTPTPITDIAIEKDSTVWVGTDGIGLIKINNNNISFLNTSNSDLLSNGITSIAIDKNGYKWIGLYRKGISKFK